MAKELNTTVYDDVTRDIGVLTCSDEMWGHWMDGDPNGAARLTAVFPYNEHMDNSISLWGVKQGAGISHKGYVDCRIVNGTFLYSTDSIVSTELAQSVKVDSSWPLNGHPKYGKIGYNITPSPGMWGTEGSYYNYLVYDLQYNDVCMLPTVTWIDPNDSLHQFSPVTLDIASMKEMLENDELDGLVPVRININDVRVRIQPQDDRQGMFRGPGNYDWRYKLICDTIGDTPLSDIMIQQIEYNGPNTEPDEYPYDVMDKTLLNIYNSNYSGRDDWNNQRIGYLASYNVNNLMASIQDRQTYSYDFVHLTSGCTVDDISWHTELHFYAMDVENYIITELTNSTAVPIDTRTVLGFSYYVIDSKPYEMSDAEAFVKICLHEIASVGYWFAEDSTHVNDDLGSEGTGVGIYLPEFDAMGYTTGRYFTGEDIATAPNADMESVREELDYDPDFTPDDDDEGDDGEEGKRTGDWSYTFNNISVGVSGKFFSLTETDINRVFGWLRGTWDDSGTLRGNIDYDGINGGEWITSVKQFPIEIPHDNNDLALKLAWKPIQYDAGGGSMANVLCKEFDYNAGNCTYDLGQIKIDNSIIGHGDFRGYSRTALFVRLPFYGDYELDINRYYPNQFKVKAVVDFPNGVGMYYMMTQKDNNWYVMDTAEFRIGIDIPVSAVANGTYQADMYNAMSNLTQAKFNRRMNALKGVAKTAGGAIEGAFYGANGAFAGVPSGAGVGAALGGANEFINTGQNLVNDTFDITRKQYDIDHAVPAASQLGGSSPFCTLIQDLKVSLITFKPRMDGDWSTYKPIYASTIGYACRKYDVLSQFKGYTEVDNVNLSGINCTSQEKSIIIKMLQNGVYL